MDSAHKNFVLRLAKHDDYEKIEKLIEVSALVLQQDDYSEAQIRGALGTVFGVDTQLIDDGSYYVIETDNTLVACGGWSKRQTLFGGDANKNEKADPLLDPAKDPARIRAFFVDPKYSRRGLGQLLIDQCEQASLSEGFKKMTLVATLSGERLYAKAGYQEVKRFEIELVNNELMPVVSMEKTLAG